MSLKPLTDSQRKVYSLLAAAGEKGCLTADLGLKAGFRFGGRINELRAMPGCQITTERLSQNSSRYVLVSPPSVESLGAGRDDPDGVEGGGVLGDHPAPRSVEGIEGDVGASGDRPLAGDAGLPRPERSGRRPDIPLSAPSLAGELALFENDSSQKPPSHWEDV